MAKAPFLMGAASATPATGRKEHARAVEEGIEIVRQAIKVLLDKPKEERDAYLATIGGELQSIASHLGTVDGVHGRRVKATKNIVKILQDASSAKP